VNPKRPVPPSWSFKLARGAVLASLASAGVYMAGCEREKQEPPRVAVDPDAERRTVEGMLSVLDDRGLAFDDEATPGTQDALAQRTRIVLELQAMLQTELELTRRRLVKTNPEHEDLALLASTRAALEQGQLARFIRERARPKPGTPNDPPLFFAELESALRKAVQQRVARLNAAR
jgi:hypothetical protein